MAERAKERALSRVKPPLTTDDWCRKRDAEELARYRATLRLGNVFLRQRHNWFGEYEWVQVPVTREGCAKCGRPNPDVAHTVLEYVGAVLAEPLRRQFETHLEHHGCGTGDTADPRYIGGFGHCPTAMELFRLLPPGDTIVIA
jgi:hypothetical protein